MRITYNTYSHKYGDQEHDEDVGLWVNDYLQGGIEDHIKKMRSLTILFTEDLLSRHPEKIDQVVEILGAYGRDHKIEDDQ